MVGGLMRGGGELLLPCLRAMSRFVNRDVLFGDTVGHVTKQGITRKEVRMVWTMSLRGDDGGSMAGGDGWDSVSGWRPLAS